MTSASVHEALAVLSRTAGWLARGENSARARYVEATLARWADFPEGVVEDDVVTTGFREIHQSLVGFDAEPDAGRSERLALVLAQVDRLRSRVGPGAPPPAEARAVLLPAGILGDLAPRIVAPPAVPPPGESLVEEALRAESRYAESRYAESRYAESRYAESNEEPRGREEHEPGRDGGRDGRESARSEGSRSEGSRSEGSRTDGRRPRGDGDRDRGDRDRGDRDRGERRDRPEGRAPREGREARPGREPRAEGRGREGRGGESRGGDSRGEPRAELPEPVREVESPRPAPEPPRAPPEPRTFALGHPEGSGEPLDALDVFEDAELEALALVGVRTVADLFMRPPVTTERAGERWIPGVTPDGAVIVRGTVRRRITRFTPGVRRHEVRVGHDKTDDKADIVCRWLGPIPAEVLALTVGADVGLAGLIQTEDEPISLYEAEPLGIDGRGGDWFPTYGVEGVPDTQMRAAMRAGLRRHADSLQDHLPAELLERYRLVSLTAALRDVHFPSNASRKGRSRLGFDELLQVQLGVSFLRSRERRDRGLSNAVSHGLVSRSQGTAGWQFTDEQEAAFDDLRRDMRRPLPMARLLQGDVGVGKYAVVQAAMIMVAEAKHQALFLAPDALAAEHRFLFAEAFLRSVGIEPMLIVGQPSRAQVEALKKGDALVIYATHALTREVPAFRRLGLVVFEEQGTYGAADIAPFEVQGQRPDLLVFTPTPVPSALALNLYGQLAMTLVHTGACRGVETTAYDATARDEAYARARSAIEDGHQVMIVFPVIRGQDLLSPSEARRLSEVLGSQTFPGARIGIFNGGMSREERFRAYDDFQHRRTDVLLATTYLEHGPVVPNASVLIVEQAQQYDLVRLHRLRSHIGNGWRKGQCLLVVGDDPRPEARFNIDLLLAETDGFRIAELDLRHRGVEQALGEKAADAPNFAWADPVSERDLLVKTRQEAVRMLLADPGLKRRANRALLNLVRARFGEDAAPETPAAAAPPGNDAQSRKRRRRRGGR